MRRRICSILAVLLLAAPAVAQDLETRQDSAQTRDVTSGGGYGEMLNATNLADVETYLFISGMQTPQHGVLKGMGLRLRQINDWVVYEHFDLADQTGMVADDVLANLPAHKAGIRWHDVITKVDDKPISSVEGFVEAYIDCEADEVPVLIIQKGRPKTVTILKSEVAKWEKDYRIGVHVEPVPKELALHLGWQPTKHPGLYISSVVKDSPAEKAGLKAGDLLLNANEKPLKSQDVLNTLVRESQGREMTLRVLRAGKTQEINLAAEEQPTIEVVLDQSQGLMTSRALLSLAGYDAKLNTLLPKHQHGESAAIQRLTEAIENLSKDVAELRRELKEKE